MSNNLLAANGLQITSQQRSNQIGPPGRSGMLVQPRYAADTIPYVMQPIYNYFYLVLVEWVVKEMQYNLNKRAAEFFRLCRGMYNHCYKLPL